MKKSLKLLCTAAPAVFLLLCCTAKAFALTEAEVQAQVDAVGKEAVTGNVLIWFLCAIAFLKVSHKMDSLIHALGITTGHTGGSVMAELMIAARSISAVRNGHRHGGSSGGTSDSPGFFQGGLAGVVSRGIEHGASQSATGNGSGGIGGKVYSSSLSKGGSFANRVIGNIATGSISSAGTISGENAAGALMSYLGYTALGEGAADVPSFSNVEIGGGRILATEISAEHPEGISIGMYHADQYGKYGKGIINVCKTKIILNLEDEEAQRVQNTLRLSDAEIMEITHFERGSGLISTNNNNITVEFRCSDLEKSLITTDRRELQALIAQKQHTALSC